MFVNVASLSFYMVMTFTPHQECIPMGSKSSSTSILTATYIIGFSLHLVNFVIATFVEPVLRKEMKKKVAEQGMSSEARRLINTSFILEHAFRVAFILFSFWQLVMINGPGIAYCKEKSKALEEPINWVFLLAMS